MVLTITGTTGKTESEYGVAPRSSKNSHSQFSFAHPIDPKNRKELMYFIIFNDKFTFSKVIYKISGQFQDKWHFFSNSRSFSGPQVKFKDFSICSHCILSICYIYLFPVLVLRAGFAF